MNAYNGLVKNLTGFNNSQSKLSKTSVKMNFWIFLYQFLGDMSRFFYKAHEKLNIHQTTMFYTWSHAELLVVSEKNYRHENILGF